MGGQEKRSVASLTVLFDSQDRTQVLSSVEILKARKHVSKNIGFIKRHCYDLTLGFDVIAGERVRASGVLAMKISTGELTASKSFNSPSTGELAVGV
ncbi:MAG: hypothetical protein EOO18_11465 [Chryseobacterium sp.]|nr:MAG: hypothetical protein EOO18_11465 [Chryseobacterium sp.]